MGVTQVADLNQFHETLKSAPADKLIVVDFYATWCGPCKMIAPKIEKYSEEYTDVIFLKVDVDEAEEVSEQNEITAMPTVIFFKNNKEVEKVMGANADKIKETIEKLK